MSPLGTGQALQGSHPGGIRCPRKEMSVDGAHLRSAAAMGGLLAWGVG